MKSVPTLCAGSLAGCIFALIVMASPFGWA